MNDLFKLKIIELLFLNKEKKKLVRFNIKNLLS